MPNWCDNELYIKGPKAQVEDFLERVSTHDDEESKDEGSSFDFNKIVPYPEEYRLMDDAASKWEEEHRDIPWDERPPRPQDGYNLGGYEWCKDKWGTKWNASGVTLSRSRAGAKIKFETPWSPPVPVIAAASELFPDLEFTLKFWEGGAGYKGVALAKGGSVAEETSSYTGSRGG